MQDRLILSALARGALHAEASRARPAECCGLLAGRDGRVDSRINCSDVGAQDR